MSLALPDIIQFDFKSAEKIALQTAAENLLEIKIPVTLTKRKLYGYLFGSTANTTLVLATVLFLLNGNVVEEMPLEIGTSAGNDTGRSLIASLVSSNASGGNPIADCLLLSIGGTILTGENQQNILIPHNINIMADTVSLRIRRANSGAQYRAMLACISER